MPENEPLTLQWPIRHADAMSSAPILYEELSMPRNDAAMMPPPPPVAAGRAAIGIVVAASLPCLGAMDGSSDGIYYTLLTTLLLRRREGPITMLNTPMQL